MTNTISWDQIASLERLATQRGCGALVTFLGIVRGDPHGGRTTQALYYEAYTQMAERQIDRLVAEAQARWLIDRVYIRHRLGRVEVGQISVVVVVAAQHRAQVYAASQFLINRIKRDAPIWKREIFNDGRSRWVMCSPEVVHVVDPKGAVNAHV